MTATVAIVIIVPVSICLAKSTLIPYLSDLSATIMFAA